MKSLIIILMATTLITLAGCGGGGGGDTTTTATTPTATPVAMTLKISTIGTLPAGTSLSGVGFTVTLPAGVTPATETNGTLSAGVVTPSGVLSANTATSTQNYSPAAGATAGKIEVTVASSAVGGFGTGELVSIAVSRASSTVAPTSADFPLSNVAPADLLYSPVAGISGSLAVQ